MNNLPSLIRRYSAKGAPLPGRYPQNDASYHFESGHSHDVHLNMFDSPYTDIVQMFGKIHSSGILHPYYAKLKEFSSAYYRVYYSNFCKYIKSEKEDYAALVKAWDNGDIALKNEVVNLVGTTKRSKYSSYITGYLTRTNFDVKWGTVYDKFTKKVLEFSRKNESGAIGPAMSLYTYLTTNRQKVLNTLRNNVFTVDVILDHFASDLALFKDKIGLEKQ